MNRLNLFFVTFFFTLMLSSCASQTTLTESSMFEQFPKVAELNKQLNTARSLEYDMLSPIHFARAVDSYTEASKLAIKGNERANTFADQGLAQLNVAKSNAAISTDVLEYVLTARRAAISAGANAQKSKDFAAAENDLVSLARLIEEGKTDRAKSGREKLLTAYRAIELASLKGDTVERAKEELNNAKKKDADKIAPKTYQLAQNELTLARKVLDADRTNTVKAEVNAQNALWNAQRSIQIVDIITNFKTSDFSEEDKVLWYQNEIAKVVAPIELNVAFNIPNKALIKSLNTEIQHLADSNKALDDQLDTKKQALSLAAEVTEEERRQNEEIAAKFSLVQSLFSESEAEVYRQSDNVLIRAHGFNFPSGVSEIESYNFALLNKIISAIKEFPGSKIIVSGHTDNVGGDKMNMALSEARAEKVAKFLNEVGQIGIERITSRGYGMQRPVYGNETPDGRAANRRIEVLIVN